MKRDWDVIRSVLLAVEEEKDLLALISGSGGNEQRIQTSQGQLLSDDVLCGHIKLLVDADLIEGVSVSHSHGHWLYSCRRPMLTMQGHDLLDTLRPVGMPQRLTKFANERGVELTIDTIKAVFGAFVGSVLA
ncbi:DUF2513 domain-containing protein [Aeromonas enterica]